MYLYRLASMNELKATFASGMKSFQSMDGHDFTFVVHEKDVAKHLLSLGLTGTEPCYLLRAEIGDDNFQERVRPQTTTSDNGERSVAASSLEELNRHVHGLIQVVSVVSGRLTDGFVPDRFGLRGKNAKDQARALLSAMNHAPMDFALEVKANAFAVLANYAFWEILEPSDLGQDSSMKTKFLDGTSSIWKTANPGLELPKFLPSAPL